MKINITKSVLLEGIQVVSAGVSSRTTLPILHNFLLEAKKGKLKLVRTDMNIYKNYKKKCLKNKHFFQKRPKF